MAQSIDINGQHIQVPDPGMDRQQWEEANRRPINNPGSHGAGSPNCADPSCPCNRPRTIPGGRLCPHGYRYGIDSCDSCNRPAHAAQPQAHVRNRGCSCNFCCTYFRKKDEAEKAMLEHEAHMRGNAELEAHPFYKKAAPSCECGSESVGSGGHSTWCPKWVG